VKPIIFACSQPSLLSAIDVHAVAQHLPIDITPVIDLGPYHRPDLLADLAAVVRTNEDGPTVPVHPPKGLRVSKGINLPISWEQLWPVHHGHWGRFGHVDAQRTGRFVNLRARCRIPEDAWVLLEQDQSVSDDQFRFVWLCGAAIQAWAVPIPVATMDRVSLYRTANAVYSRHPRFAAEALALGIPAHTPAIVATKQFRGVCTPLAAAPETLGLAAKAVAIADNIHDRCNALTIARDLAEKHYPVPLGSVHVSLNAYKRSGLVQTAIRGIANQTHPDVTASIVDDGSNDMTPDNAQAAISASHCLRKCAGVVLLNRNSGAAAAWNVGMTGTSRKAGHLMEVPPSDWVTYTSSDNIALGQQLYELVRAGELEHADIVVSQYRVFGGNDGMSVPQPISLDRVGSGGGLGPSFVFRRALLNETDLMHEDMQGIEDTFLTHDLLLCEPLVYVSPRYLYYYRGGDRDSLTYQIIEGEGSWFSLIDRMQTCITDRTTVGWARIETLITDNPAAIAKAPGAKVVSPADFNPDDCFEPGQGQVYVDREGMVKKCPFARYSRGRMTGNVMFNRFEHVCLRECAPFVRATP